MFTPNNLFQTLVSIVCGLGVMLTAAFALTAAVASVRNLRAHEPAVVLRIMRWRRILSVFMAVSIAVDLCSKSWQVTRISMLAALAIYAICVYAIVPAKRRMGVVSPK